MLNKPFVTENPPCNARNCHRNNHGKDKSPGFTLHTVDEVHTEHRGHQGRNHHEDGHRCQRTHHRIHIIVNNTLVSIHRRLKNVRVDAGGLSGLGHLNIHVLNEVGVQFVDL